ncbi:MAG: methionyl-tRNA formyltransferase [Myxococcales bacterium]|nr:MAG: methionyl-tRNA formyltransferase [Myxococcales bacterium]
MLRTIFMGTPDFAVPSLKALAELTEVVAVVSQPDRPSGRGMKLKATPVKAAAQSLGLSVYQPERVKNQAFLDWFKSQRADLAVVVAYGRILSKKILVAPSLGCLNVHASLLPRWRGAAPIQWAIFHGDQRTGVTLMQMDEGMDTGDILSQMSTDIGPNESTGELAIRLAELGGDILRRDLLAVANHAISARKQDEELVTMAPLISKSDGDIDWHKSASDIHNQIRAMHPWPCASTLARGKRIKIHRSRVLVSEGHSSEVGKVVRADEHGIEVVCGDGILVIEELQLEGRSKLKAGAFLSGYRLQAGDKLVS